MYYDEAVVRPYARALVLSAQALGILDRVRGDMEALQAQWDGSPLLQTWCTTARSLPRAAHKEAIQTLWGETMAHPTCVLLEALSTAGLLAAIPKTIRVFRRFADRAEGKIKVEFVFAAAPSPTLLADLKQRAIAAYGEQTEITVRTDATLGAGMIVRAGHTQIDASLKGRLARLRQRFAQ
ncbi:MAG: F0F1 ATP synthase subunit delta [Kiritimatiellae bacterium]|nr:F0F1 ATP synthase subunit delta [Kiritimatiellia bacterium]